MDTTIHTRFVSTAGRSAASTAALLLGLFTCSVSYADRQEWHLSPVGIVGASSTVEGGRTVWSFAGGAGIRAAYGIADSFELGVQGHFSTSQGILVPGVVVASQPGNLAADLYAVELAVDLRLVGGVSLSRAFARFHPFMGARAGGLVRILTAQALVDDQRQLVLRLGDATTILPTVTGYLGGEYRFARSWLAGLLGSFTYATGGNYAATLAVELSWMTY